MIQLDSLCEKLNLNQCENIKPLKQLAQKLNVKEAHLGLGFILISLILVVVGWGAEIISGLFGLVYPAYMSFKTLQNDNHDQNKHWLTYWIVYSFVLLFDPILECVLSFIPMYHFFKLAFFVWLFNPKTNGAGIIYDKLLFPLLEKYQVKIDDQINNITNKAQKLADKSKPMVDNAGFIVNNLQK